MCYFFSRKHEYEIDYCYHQNDDTSVMFSKEIKPKIAKVFDGENSTFIAFGARGSGKTCTIQVNLVLFSILYMFIFGYL